MLSYIFHKYTYFSSFEAGNCVDNSSFKWMKNRNTHFNNKIYFLNFDAFCFSNITMTVAVQTCASAYETAPWPVSPCLVSLHTRVLQDIWSGKHIVSKILPIISIIVVISSKFQTRYRKYHWKWYTCMWYMCSSSNSLICDTCMSIFINKQFVSSFYH